MLIAKAKLNSVEILMSKALIDTNITHDELVSINNVSKEYDDIKEEVRNLENLTVTERF